MSNTAVNEKDLPMPEVQFHNTPETLDAAIARIMELEMRLEDLARACEIVQITRQLELLEGFAASAVDCLANKITIEQPGAEGFKLTVVTDKEEEAL